MDLLTPTGRKQCWYDASFNFSQFIKITRVDSNLFIIIHCDRINNTDYQIDMPPGHTISHNGKSYHFHLLPSGLMNPKCINLIGTGVVVHIPSFFKELAELEEKGLDKPRERIFISDRAHLSLKSVPT